MLYTVGHAESYREGFRQAKLNNTTNMKLGRRWNYKGGIVFQSVTDARVYLQRKGVASEYEVFGLDASKKDVEVMTRDSTRPDTDLIYGWLLNNRAILPLNNEEKPLC